MIHRIAVENFFSIAERQEMELKVPANSPALPCFRGSRANSDQRLPVTVGIFGPNASGKSTALRAIVSAASFARLSFKLDPAAQILSFNPYAHQSWWNLPTKISVDFDSQLAPEGKVSVFRYELHIQNSAERFANSVAYEAMYFAPEGKFRMLFERKMQEFTFGREFGILKNDPRLHGIRPNASVISTLAQLNHKVSTDLIASSQGLQSNIIGVAKAEGHMPNVLGYYLQRPDHLAKLNQELSRLDLGLEEMRVLAGTNGPTAEFSHLGLGCNMVLALESDGTKRFIETFPLLQFALDTGGIAIIDELDTEIHPFLIPELFRWFYSLERNPKGAQLLFTAHNPAILDELEKEQVYLTEKPSGKPTRIYCASDIQGLRRQPSLMKKYMSGELGAVPRIG